MTISVCHSVLVFALLGTIACSGEVAPTSPENDKTSGLASSDQAAKANEEAATDTKGPRPSGETAPPNRTPPDGGSPPPGIQAAIQACEGKTADTACSFTFEEHKVEGKCVMTPKGVLGCRPEPPSR
jgi:hypothetical protein